MDECNPLVRGPRRAPHVRQLLVLQRRQHGEAVQLDPIKSTLKAPGTKRLKLKYD